MARSTSVWGIDVGQAALKALRCRLDGNQVVAEAFDYIEYPKILTQPEAEPEAMVREALQTFIGRNDLKKTKVALSVPGQNGLAKFFKPPPVEIKKIGDIVKYEARQQIPFDLQDVVWDYQLMAGGQVENGFALESEVGLFAMKRDAVYRTLKPLQQTDIEVDVLQLAPLSIYNAITYDKQLLLQGNEDNYDTEHPPKSVVILAMGTDATDLIVTNGYRVWQRSMPLGGNHFTRQLTKDLKLTFAKAEHLKRNAMEADDPKLIFQAMRPVFNDLVTEIQRSIGFFRTLNKKAEIGALLMLGNSVKLPGLTQYLNKNLSMEVSVVDKFDRLLGEEVLSSPAFRDHITSFASVYGLCLQGLNSTAVYTNLIPQELFTERLVRAKKPWVVATAATLMLGMAGSLLPAGGRFNTVHPDKWKSALTSADSTKSTSDTQISEDKKQLGQVELLTKIGGEVSGSRDRRLLWMEILSAIDQSLARPDDIDLVNPPDPKKVPFNERDTIFVTKMDCKFFDDLSTYQTEYVKAAYEANKKSRLVLLDLIKEDDVAAEEAATEEATTDSTTTSTTDATAEEGSTNPGWVFEIEAYHHHNGKDDYRQFGDEQDGFVLKGLIQRLEEGSVKLPVINDKGETELMEFTYKEMGISNPMLVGKGFYNAKHTIPNPQYKPPANTMSGDGMGGSGMGDSGRGGGMGMGMGMGSSGMGSSGMGGMGMGGMGMGGVGGVEFKEDPDNPTRFEAPKYSFKVQFIWKEKPLSVRLAERKAKEEEARKAKEAEEGTVTQESGENVAAN
jgi:type IV pilus assembly protein PilM